MFKIVPSAVGWTASPYADQAAAHTRHWAEELGIGTSRLQKYATLAAWVYPDSAPEFLNVQSDIFAFYRLYDDYNDSIGADLATVHRISGELCRVLEHGRATSTVGRVFADLWERQVEGAPAFWMNRVARHWEWYFATQASYTSLRNPPAAWNASEYLTLRNGNGGVAIALTYGEPANQAFLPPHIYHLTTLRRMRKIANDEILYCNDLYSSRRDRKNDDPRNLVALHRTYRGCTWQEAEIHAEQTMFALDRQLHQEHSHLDEECHRLQLNEHEQHLAHTGAKIIHDWNSGYQAWALSNEPSMEEHREYPELALGGDRASSRVHPPGSNRDSQRHCHRLYRGIPGRGVGAPQQTRRARGEQRD
jgi:hypothetical protein